MRDEIYAIRKGLWKVHFITKRSYSKESPIMHNPPLLYNIDQDPSEKYEIGKGNKDIIKEIQEIYET
jgi:arylsulfatase A